MMILPATSRRPEIIVPQTLKLRMINGHGEAAAMAWLEQLPALLDDWCTRWNLRVLSGMPPLSFNLVLFATSATADEVVLKLNLPSSEVHSEIEALAQAHGEGMVRLIDADPSAALMMLERIAPGTVLQDVPMPDLESTAIGAEIMKRFWRRPERYDHLHTLRDWFRALFSYPIQYSAGASPIPMDLVERAIMVADRLLSDPRDEVLLHGDIHHQNILQGSERGWITIDPKGLIGERGYDIATWMLNPWGIGALPDLEELMVARLELFSRELGIDRQRLTELAFMHSVLSMCWTLEDDGLQDLTDNLRCSTTLAGFLDGNARS
ncbi:MAG: phosphotransferase [Chloroflexota bacterium]|nr:phosphotransferase [Chloroflexota bacterium]